MPSALTNQGSTWAWRNLRNDWQQRINDAGGWTCWRCHHPIHPHTPFHLGHTTDRALGGNDDHLAPEHPRCSTSAGGKLGSQLQKLRHRPTPSRSW